MGNVIPLSQENHKLEPRLRLLYGSISYVHISPSALRVNQQQQGSNVSTRENENAFLVT